MASLALVVSLIFLVVLLSGPVAALFAVLRLPRLAILFGLAAAASGLWWAYVAPTSIGVVGLISFALGVLAANNGREQLRSR